MTFIRTVTYVSGYTRVDNRAIRDPQLSFRGGGFLTYLLSLPNDWVISLAHLSNVKETCGRTVVTSSLNELRRLGYVLRVDYRYKGRFQTEYTVFENKDARAAWMELNNVEDGQKFDHKPEFVIPDLSDPEDIEAKEANSKLSPKKPRKNAKTDEQLQAEAEAKAADRKAKAEEKERQKALRDQEKAEKEKLKLQKIEEDKIARHNLFGSQERYTNFTRWYWGFYVKGAGAGLDNPGRFFDVVMENLLAGGERYRSMMFQFEAAEKEHQKRTENQQLNAQAAQIAERAVETTEQSKTPEAGQKSSQEQTEAPQHPSVTRKSVEGFLRADDLQLFSQANLRGELLEGCLKELARVKSVPIMHEKVIRQYRQLQERKDYQDAQAARDAYPV